MNHPDTLAALEQILADIAADKRRRPPAKQRTKAKRAAIA